jgi:hypothetical protein
MSEAAWQKMVKVSVEVRSGTARFRVGVQARSIREALDLVSKRYQRGVTNVVFPIEPESFFVRESSVPACIVGSLRPHAKAA